MTVSRDCLTTVKPMNNENGAALLARVKPGDLVTIRRYDGSRRTGRAHSHHDMTGRREFYVTTGYDAMPESVTAGNIIKVEPSC